MVTIENNFFATIVFIIFAGAYLQLLQTSRFHDSNVISMELEKRNSIEHTENRMELRRTILKRGCSMVKSLYEMSTNRTSFEELLKWHQRIENISFPISSDGKDCFPPYLGASAPLVMYQIHTENSRLLNKNISWLSWIKLLFEKLIVLLSALFCLPPKCGCTSYQRALGSQLTKEFLREGKQCKQRPCYDQSVINKAKNDLS